MTLSSEDMKKLRSPFTKDRLGVKVQAVSREKTRAMLVLYAQHTDVMDRLEEVDPAWSSDVTKEWRDGDTYYCQMKLTLKGVSRMNVGEGAEPKGAYSDAIKRCAMLFGVCRYLYDTPVAWAPYDETKDRYRIWTVPEYEAAARAQVPVSEDLPPQQTLADVDQGVRPKVQAAPRTNGAGVKKSERSEPAEDEKARMSAQRKLFAAYRIYSSNIPDVQMSELLRRRYNKPDSASLTLAEMKDLTEFMEMATAEAEPGWSG